MRDFTIIYWPLCLRPKNIIYNTYNEQKKKKKYENQIEIRNDIV